MSKDPSKPTSVIGTPGGEPVSVELAEEELTPAEERSRSRSRSAQDAETTLRTTGQRRINLLWEATQAVVTVLVVGTTLYIAGALVLSGNGEDSNRAAAFLLLSNAFFMIVTAYYQRTNHTRTGGVGGRDVDTDR